MYEFYNSTGGPNWRWDHLDIARNIWHFEDGANPCKDQWQGIVCINTGTTLNEDLHIQSIFLADRNLCGTLPNTLDSLPYLESLDLPDNYINGTIPPSLGNLQYMWYLNIKDNDLTGPIPTELGYLNLLQHLGIDFNYLTGPIPDQMWSNYTNMSVVLISHNHLTGTIPEILGTLLGLHQLYVCYNDLHGTIPLSLSNLTQLHYLDMDANSFVGQIPDFSGMSRLLFLGLHSNLLTGPLPSYIDQLPELLNLFFDDNYFTGTIPKNFGSLTGLKFLQMESNFLTGTIPDSLGSIASLRYLYVNNNLLTGSLPKSLVQLTFLKSLLVQENQLTGNLDGLFNHTTQRLLNTIQLSNNQFTGSLPTEAFLLKDLQALISVSNCFEGSIPQEVCGCELLLTLALDGLRSASSCRRTILPGISSAYKLSNTFGGTVPACLFSLPRINTLHLSGNALTGSLPGDIEISNELVDLSLSHNVLSGTIPTNIQNRVWYNLDLSYNRFEGDLRSDFYAIDRNFSVKVTVEELGINYTEPSTTAALSLLNNRLSGEIPSKVKHMVNISVLSGNLFTCAVGQTDLPPHDPGQKTYQCGSNFFDVPYFAWLGLVFMLLGTALSAYYWRRDIDKYIGLSEMILVCEHWLRILSIRNNQSEVINSKLKSVSYVCLVFDVVTKVSCWCTLFVLFVLLPFYLIVTAYYGTHVTQYAYSVSAVYISGVVPFVIEVIFFACLLAVLVGATMFYIRQFDHIHEKLLSEYQDDRSLYSVARSDAEGEGEENDHQASKLERILVCVVFFLISVTIVLGVNIAFVYVALYQDSALFLLAQVLLSVFKVGWNVVCSPYLIQWTSNYLYSAATADRKASRTGFFSLQLFVSLFNNIGIPCVVVMVIDPNCFYNLLVPAKSETSRFLYAQCNDYAIIGCINLSRTIAGSSYNPPFKYSYQCSSSFITYYAPTFVYVCFVSTFVAPLFMLGAFKVYEMLPRKGLFFHFMDYFLPPVFKPLEEGADHTIQRQIFNPFFDPNAFLITHLTFLCVLLTFGAMFPPLAAALLVTMLVGAHFEKLRLGRFICTVVEKQRLVFLDIVATECQGVGSIRKLREAMWMIVTFCCIFYTAFLFDTLGDSSGFNAAAAVLVIGPLAPLCAYAIRSVYTYYERRAQRRPHTTDVEEPPTVMMEMRKSSVNGVGKSADYDHSEDNKSKERGAWNVEAPMTFNAMQHIQN